MASPIQVPKFTSNSEATARRSIQILATSDRALDSHGRFSRQPGLHGSAGIYYGPSTQMVGSGSLNSDGFASYTSWDATCFTDAGNTTFNGSNLCSGAPRRPRAQHHWRLLAQQSFPQRSRPHLHHSSSGIGQQSGAPR